MKEHKYRARSFKGEWFYFELFEVTNHFPDSDTFYVGGVALDKGTVSQCTGLQDRNGRDAYHKDIVCRMDTLYTIEWHDNLAGWYLKSLTGGCWHGITKSDMALMCAVVGGIKESPELLEADDEHKR